MVTPGVLVMMIVGATNLAYSGLSLHASLLINIAPVTLFVLVCFFAKSDFQVCFISAVIKFLNGFERLCQIIIINVLRNI